MQRTFEQRIQQRKNELQEVRGIVESLKVSLEENHCWQLQEELEIQFIQVLKHSLSDCDVCPNSGLHRQQWRTVRRSSLISFTPLREAALRWHSWSELRKELQWVELKNDWSNWSRRSWIWGGERLSWSSLHAHNQMTTSVSSR